MNFKYFKDTNNEIFAFDIDDETQLPYMQKKIEEGCTDITGSWPPPQVNIEPPAQSLPTKEELLAQIKILTDQINSLSL